MTPLNRSMKTLAVIALLGILFLVIVLCYQKPFLQTPDDWVMKNISALHQKGLNQFFVALSHFASRNYQYGILIFYSFLWVVIEKRGQEPFILAVCLMGARYGNHWLKDMFERERPAFEQVIGVAGYSLPSGHAMINTAFFGLLVFLVMQHSTMNRSHKGYVYGSTVLFVLLVGFSRVYLGVHYPTDVFAGFLAGGAWLLICVLFYHHFLYRKEAGSQ
jgi:undecaprenyl-diphosphatase